MGKKESLQTTPRLVKEVPEGYKEEMRDGKKVFVKRKETPIPKTPKPVSSTTTNKPKSGTPRKLPPPTPKKVEPELKVEEDVVYMEDIKPDPIPTQKVQHLRTDLKEEFPGGLQKGYHQYKVPDLTKGANYTDAKTVITDSEGMPVVYDFTTNKYVKTGEPSIHSNMPVQNDTPTIQEPLKENQLPTKFDVVPERLRTPSYNTPKVVTPTVDENIYKGFNDVGLPNETKTDMEFQKKQSENLAVPQKKDITSQPFAKGGIVKKIKGYADGTTKEGVVGQNDPYAAKRAEEEQKKKDAQNAQNRETLGSTMGAYGKTYAATAKPSGSEDSTTKAAMGVVSDMGAVGGVVGGAYGIIDQIARPEKNKAEKMDITYDANGNATAKLSSSAAAKDTAIAGSFLSPSEALTTRMSYEGGMTDISGKGYADYLEKKAQEQLDVYNKANETNKQNQAVNAREAGNLNATVSNQYNLRGTSFNDNKKLEGVKEYAKGGIVGKMKQMCADGGEIKGKGGPKSDSIKAEVEEGSFIVPAENAELAKGIRKLYLKAPIKKANLKQEEGEEVKLSNGEHLFTPEENEYLESIGVELEALAPNAEDGNEKAEGGEFSEEDTVDPKKERDRIAKEEAEIKKAESEKQSAKNKLDTEKNIKKHRDFIQEVLIGSSKRKSELETEYERVKNGKNADYKGADAVRERLKTLLDEIDAQDKKIKEVDSEYRLSKNDSNYDASGNFKPSVENKAKTKTATPDLTFKPKSNQSDKTYDELIKKPNHARVSDAEWKKAVDDSIAKGTVIPKVGVSTTTPTKPSLKAPVVKKKAVTEPFTVNANPDEEVIVPGDKLSPNERAIANADAEKATVQAATLNKSLPQSVATNGTPQNQKRGLADVIGSFDPTSIVGIGQMFAGKKMLSGEVRPVDKAVIDPTYNASVEKALQQATFGLSPEQRLMAEQDIANARRDADKAGVNFSGGSGTTAYNFSRAAANDMWKAKLGLSVADQEARMAKQKYADAMAADRASILDKNRRQAFNDAMYTFQQKQQAGGELVGAGLQNIIGAYRFNKELQRSDKINDASNPYKNV